MITATSISSVASPAAWSWPMTPFLCLSMRSQSRRRPQIATLTGIIMSICCSADRGAQLRAHKDQWPAGYRSERDLFRAASFGARGGAESQQFDVYALWPRHGEGSVRILTAFFPGVTWWIYPAFALSMMLGEILTISFEQTRNVLLTDIDSSPHLFGFTGL